MTEADCFRVGDVGWSTCGAEDVAAVKGLEGYSVYRGRSLESALRTRDRMAFSAKLRGGVGRRKGLQG